MKTRLAAFILIFSTFTPSIAEEVKPLVIVNAPETWKVEFQGNNVLQVYSVTRKEGGLASLQFTRFPGDIKTKQNLEDVEIRAASLLALAEGQKHLTLKSLAPKNNDFKRGEIHGDAFSGRFAKFEMEGELYKILFIIGDSEQNFPGEFIGKEEHWFEALSILQKLKKG
ncbi:hypothetical protein [Luteolibacter sp. AS25]|uniref:hypothetical protein n=1 Tax=Luteolibacter sp. AS25 TaxID=3135776 RepID=UPI00398ADF8F